MLFCLGSRTNPVLLAGWSNDYPAGKAEGSGTHIPPARFGSPAHRCWCEDDSQAGGQYWCTRARGARQAGVAPRCSQQISRQVCSGKQVWGQDGKPSQQAGISKGHQAQHPCCIAQARGRGRLTAVFTAVWAEVRQLHSTNPGHQPQSPGKGREAEKQLGADGSGTKAAIAVTCRELKVLGAKCLTWIRKTKHPKRGEQCLRAIGNLSHQQWKQPLLAFRLTWGPKPGLTSDQVPMLLHPLSRKCSRSGLHSLRNHPASTISTTLSFLFKKLNNYPVLPHHRQTQSKIVKCINKPADKWLSVNLSLLAQLVNSSIFCIQSEVEQANKGESFVLANDMSKHSSESDSADFDPLRKEKSSLGTYNNTASPWACASKQPLPYSYSLGSLSDVRFVEYKKQKDCVLYILYTLKIARPREIKSWL